MTNHRKKYTIMLMTVMMLITVLGGVNCAYFNAFYNARKNFREAEKENRQVIQEESGRPQTQKYNNAIESAARLLQNYPNSKWADDALLLMGKAYYRIQQYNRAERKFDELFANHPNSPLIPEGKYFWALTKKASSKPEEAKKQLRELLGMEIPRDLKTNVRFALANMLFEEKSYDQARVEYAKIVEKAKEDQDRAQAQYRVAECYALTDKDSLAASAFLSVLDYKSNRKMEFDAQFRHGIALKELKQYDDVKNVFESLLKKDIYFAYFPQVELELADLQYRTGEVEEARTKYLRLVEVNPRTEVSARAFYELGVIALRNDRDMDKAKEYFSKVRGEFAQSEYQPLAQSEIAALDNYRQISDARIQLATQLIALEETIAGMREKSAPLDSTQEAPEITEADSTQLKNRIKNLYLDLDVQDFRLAEFYLYDLEDLDSTISVLDFLVRPGVSDTVRAKSIIIMASIYSDSLNNPAISDSLYQVLITDYSGTSFSNRGLLELGLPQHLTEQDSLSNEYFLADSLLWVEGDTTAALDIFQQLAMGDTTSLLTARSQFAVGWIYENMIGNKDSAEIAYRLLVDRFASTELAQNVKRRIEAVVVEPVLADSTLEPSVSDSGVVAPEITTPKEMPKETISAGEELETKRRILKR